MKLELLNHKPKMHVINIIKCGETTNRSYHPPSQKNIPLVSYLGYAKVRFKQSRVEGCMGRGKEREVTSFLRNVPNLCITRCILYLKFSLRLKMESFKIIYK